MKDYKYTFVHLKDRVLAISTYAGKTVKGVAKCAPEDTFNGEKGEELAAARCNLKVSKRRVRNAERKLKEAIRQKEMADAHLIKMTMYYNDSKVAVDEAKTELEDIMKRM